MAAAMDDGDMDSMLMDILGDLDQSMTESDRLSRAKEKLAAMFVRAQTKALQAQQASGQLQRPGPRSRTQPAPPPPPPAQPMQAAHPEHQPVVAPHRMGPRSRMEDVPPEPDYRAGPRSRTMALNPNVLARPPPPPPPNQDEISSFMDQWGAAPQAAPPEGEGQALGSALAKLRAKKAAAAAGSQQNYYDHPSQSGYPPPRPAGGAPRRPHYYGPRGREIELEFNAKSVRMFDNIMRRDWDYLMQRMYDDLWVSVFLNNFSF